MEIAKGFLYFIGDDFFAAVNDPYLKRDHKMTKRPHYFAFKESFSPLIWVVPCSSQIDKYERIIASKKAAGKPTDTIRIVKIQDKKEALLFQDMFPILPRYILSMYVRGNQPVYIANPKTIALLEKNAAKVVKLIRRGVRFTPTQPDALRIEELMLLEYQCLNIQSPALQPDLQELRAQIIVEAKQDAADRLRSITPDPAEGRRR